jgi:hypothetical protein
MEYLRVRKATETERHCNTLILVICHDYQGCAVYYSFH